jgi:hypothetical protein
VTTWWVGWERAISWAVDYFTHIGGNYSIRCSMSDGLYGNYRDFVAWVDFKKTKQRFYAGVETPPPSGDFDNLAGAKALFILLSYRHD